MRNSLLILICIVSTGCTDLKYPNWQEVRILTDLPSGYDCESVRTEDCAERDKPECPDWHKKRATKFFANTVVMRKTEYSHYGEYFKCHKPLPVLTFDSKKYATGSNTITGQAFLKQVGGAVVTCAGNPVIMIPNDQYFTAKKSEYKKEPSDLAGSLIKTGQCDAQGNFEIDNVPDGEWIVETSVVWGTPGLADFTGRLEDAAQGGLVSKKVTVKTGQKNKFIITR